MVPTPSSTPSLFARSVISPLSLPIASHPHISVLGGCLEVLLHLSTKSHTPPSSIASLIGNSLAVFSPPNCRTAAKLDDKKYESILIESNNSIAVTKFQDSIAIFLAGFSNSLNFL